MGWAAKPLDGMTLGGVMGWSCDMSMRPFLCCLMGSGLVSSPSKCSCKIRARRSEMLAKWVSRGVPNVCYVGIY